MGRIHFGINKELVSEIKKNYQVNNFIETGTYLGGTSHWASGLFKEVHTIEISEEIYKETSAKFKDVKNMHCYLGDSRDMMPGIIDKLEGPALFWLDGHWCGRNTGGKHNPCPIMDELAQAVRLPGSIILIDDLRYFLGPNPFDFGEAYPTFQEILVFLQKHLDNYYYTIHDDTVICVPMSLKPVIDADWKSNYTKRFPMTFKSISSKMLWRLKNLNFKREYKQ